MAVVAACSQPARPKAGATPSHNAAAIGETFTLDSRVLGEQRTINVYVPPDYGKTNERYPVLYMPDGGMDEDFPHVVGSVDVSIKNAVIRPVIVVGVKNTVRKRDLVGVSRLPEEMKMLPEAGGNHKFRQFLRDELKPWVEARYRTTKEAALIGESAAGLFVVETFLLEPAMFDAYIAVDPSVWWNEQELVRGAHARLAWWTAGPKQLYVATAEMQEGITILLTALRIEAPPGVVWRHDPMPHETHGTIFPTAALHGIRMVFAN
ncbi:MAG: alpha/beta hydrolase [Deltaproteobacteria bacterium]|nr:alpha/beta hydrolase [Deltaproteobacteria bacterium]